MNTTILVVDHDHNQRLLVTRTLKGAGYEVALAIDGQRALKKVAQIRPALVLLDLELPDMDGLDVLKQLRTSCPELPVVITTGAGSWETAVAAMKLGAADCVRKLATPDEVLNLVTVVLAQSTASKPSLANNLQACLAQVRLLLKHGQPDQARALLRLANVTDFGNARIHNLYGVSLELEGQLAEAARHYRAALSFEPGYSPAIEDLQRVTTWPYRRDGLGEMLPNPPGRES